MTWISRSHFHFKFEITHGHVFICFFAPDWWCLFIFLLFMFAPDLLSTTYSFRPLTHLPSSPVLLFTVCVIFICHISPGPGSPGRGHLLNSVSNYAYPFSDWFYKCYHVGSSRSPRFWTNFLCIVKPVLMSVKFLQSFKIRYPKSGHDSNMAAFPRTAT